MAIEFPCSECATVLKAGAAAAGKKCKCPKCSTVNVIPAASEDIEDEEVAAPQKANQAKQAVAAESAPRAKKKIRPVEEEEADYDGEAGVVEEEEEEEEEERRPKKGKRKKGKAKKAGSNRGLLIGGVIGLVVCFLLCGGGGIGLAMWYFKGGANDAEDMRFFPDNTESVKSQQVDQIRSSGAYKEIVAALKKDPQFDTFESQFGIDKGNVERLAVASRRASPDSITVIRTKTPVQAVEIITRFKQVDPRIAYQEAGVGKYTIQEPIGGGGGRRDAFCVVNDKTVTFGQYGVLRSVLVRGKAAELSPTMQAAMKQADFTKSETNVEDFTGGMQGVPRPPGAFGGFGGMASSRAPDRMIVEQTYGNNLSIRITATFKDPPTAIEAKREFDTAFQALKLLAPEIQAVASANNSSVVIDLTIPAKAFAKLAGGMKP